MLNILLVFLNIYRSISLRHSSLIDKEVYDKSRNSMFYIQDLTGVSNLLSVSSVSVLMSVV